MEDDVKRLEKLPEPSTPSPNEYGSLASPFSQSCEQAIDSLDEKGPRSIQYTSVYIRWRSGIVCQTDANGTIGITLTTDETRPKGRKVKKTFSFGARAEANTLARDITSASLKVRNEPREFAIKTRVDQLLQSVIPTAQKNADTIQKKIDQQNWKVYPYFFETPIQASSDFDPEREPNVKVISELTSHAYSVVAQELGAQVSELKVMCAKFTDAEVIGDSHGTQIDNMMPRMRFVIVAKTVNGSEAFGAIGGSCGTFYEMLSRNVPDAKDVPAEKLAKNPQLVSKDPFDIVTCLAQRVAKEAMSLDRAEGSSVLGKEGYVILSAQAAGVLAHEVIGHPQEADIMIENKNSQTAKIKLMGTMGARFSDHPRFNVFETPEPHFMVGKREVKYSWGAMPVFDEYGVKCKRVQLIENGRKVGALNNHYTLKEVVACIDAELGKKMEACGLSGRSRSEAFDKIPQVRMTTTVIDPDDEKGPKTVQDMAALIPKNLKGVYIKSINGGWVNPENGDFMLDGMLCFLIENGIITEKPLKGIKIQDNITRFQEKIVAIGSSETAKYPFTGYCGKGVDGKGSQWVPVEAMAPAILLQKITFGGGSVNPWQRVVEKYEAEQRKVSRGIRTAEQINVPEIAEALEASESQQSICLVTTHFSIDAEVEYILGRRINTATHKISSKDEEKLIERGDSHDC